MQLSYQQLIFVFIFVVINLLIAFIFINDQYLIIIREHVVSDFIIVRLYLIVKDLFIF